MGLLIRLAWLLVRDRSTKLGHPSRRPTQQQRAFTRHNHTPFAPQQRTEGATERFRHTVRKTRVQLTEHTSALR